MRMTPICDKTKVTAKRFSVRHLCLGLVDPEEGGIVGGNLIRVVRLPKLAGLFWRTKLTFSFQKSRKCLPPQQMEMAAHIRLFPSVLLSS